MSEICHIYRFILLQCLGFSSVARTYILMISAKFDGQSAISCYVFRLFVYIYNIPGGYLEFHVLDSRMSLEGNICLLLSVIKIH